MPPRSKTPKTPKTPKEWKWGLIGQISTDTDPIVTYYYTEKEARTAAHLYLNVKLIYIYQHLNRPLKTAEAST